jgi:acetyltransferase EpsM
MLEPAAVTVPLLNPNEPDAVVSALPVSNGTRVETGDQLATVETTKSSMEIRAERDGYVAGLAAAVGATVSAGEVLLWLADEPSWQPPAAEMVKPEPADSLRMTAPARRLASAEGVDPSDLPIGPLITVGWLRDWMAREVEVPPIDPGKLVVYGGGGHGKSVIELVRAVGGFELIGVVDDGMAPGGQVLGLDVLGGGDHLSGLRREGIGLAINAVGGIGDIRSRVAVFERLAVNGFSCPTLMHPAAFVEASATLADGVQLFPHAYVGSDAVLGFGVIVNTGAVVSHDCRLDDYANVAPGSLLAGAVRVGERTLIGMGVTVNLGVSIGPDARLGNGATVKADVPAGGVVPAGAVWPLTGRREVGA